MTKMIDERNGAPSVTQRQAAAFRLVRQHLAARAPRGSMMAVLADMAGAQAQIESAAKLSLWARVRELEVADIDAAIKSARTIAKAACMRRTLHLVPSARIAMFVRGSAKHAEKNIRWILNKGAAPPELDRVLNAVLAALSVPLTRGELIAEVARTLDLSPTLTADGWWGSTRKQPSIPIGPIACPPNYLLGLAGARGVICYAEGRGVEPTFVRADAWFPDAAELPTEEAEEELLRAYLHSNGPATPADYVVWTGIRKSDADAVWKRVAAELVPVDVDGKRAYLLARDLPTLLEADFARPTVRLLPYFDTYLLGRADRSFIAPEHEASVYRKQGWVSSVLLLDGRVGGIWGYEMKGRLLRVRVAPFSTLSRTIARSVQREAESLGRFLRREQVEVEIAERPA